MTPPEIIPRPSYTINRLQFEFGGKIEWGAEGRMQDRRIGAKLTGMWNVSRQHDVAHCKAATIILSFFVKLPNLSARNNYVIRKSRGK